MSKQASNQFQPPPEDFDDVVGHVRGPGADGPGEIVAEETDDVSGHAPISQVPGPDLDR